MNIRTYGKDKRMPTMLSGHMVTNTRHVKQTPVWKEKTLGSSIDIYTFIYQ